MPTTVSNRDACLLLTDSVCFAEISFAGHNNGVTSVCYSHLKSAAAAGKHMLLSASRDQTARLWSESNTDTSLINFSHLYKQADNVYGSASVEPTMATMSRKPSGTSLKATSNVSTKSRNRPYGEDIKHAVFFYHDQFVLLVSCHAFIVLFLTAIADCQVHAAHVQVQRRSQQQCAQHQ